MDYVGFKGFMGDIAVVLGSQITTSMGPKLVILGQVLRHHIGVVPHPMPKGPLRIRGFGTTEVALEAFAD